MEKVFTKELNTHQTALKQKFVSLDEVPQSIKLRNPIHQKHILINGELIEWNGATHLVFSPIYSTNQSNNEAGKHIIGSYPLGTAKEANQALEAAVSAYNNGRGQWATMSIQERINCLKDFAQKMLSKKDEIVKLIVWEIGKSLPYATKEFDRTIDYINDTISSAKKLSNSTTQFSVSQNFIGQTKRVPHGVVLCMGPFNYPLNETFTTLIPALIMGNTILFKPPKHGTLLFEPLSEAFAEAFPRGVVNTVYGGAETLFQG